MHFSIVKYNPVDAQPSHGFDDAIFPLYYALCSLGFSVEILHNAYNIHSRNIVFGSCIAPRRLGRQVPQSTVIFNLEQMLPGNKWCNNDYLAHLHDFTVWDYSSSNVSTLQELGVRDAVHVPLGFVPQMSRIVSQNDNTVDALFYGLMSERRHHVITDMVHRGIKVLATQEAFGNLRDTLLAHTKIVLNIHNHIPPRLEVVRLGYLWANLKTVLSEWRSDAEIPEYLADACCFAPYEELPDMLLRLLAEPILARRQAQKGFKSFASKPMAEGLKKVVGSRLAGNHLTSSLKNTLSFGENTPHEWLIRADTFSIPATGGYRELR